jgi:hypothetical protein
MKGRILPIRRQPTMRVNLWSLGGAALLTWVSANIAAAPVMSTALTPKQAGEDLELAIAAVEAGLPDVTWHQSAAEWAQGKRAARATIPNVTDADALFRILRPLLSQIGEGHLTLHRSPAMRMKDIHAQGLLPIDIHWTQEGAWITAGWGDAASIAAGTPLLAIDDETPDVLVGEMMAALGHDGHIATGAMREAEGAGYAKVRYWMRGSAPRFRLRLRDESGVTVERVVSGVAHSERPEPKSRVESPLARLEWLDKRTVLLVVPTFSNRRYRDAGSDFQSVIRRIFETVHARGARNMILDLRENGGGSEGNENFLFSFLVHDPIRKYASVQARAVAISVRDSHGRRYDVEVYDKDERRRQTRLRNGHFSRINEPPEGLMSHWKRNSPAFAGRLVVLAGGNTFSGAAELSSMLYHVRRGLFVGEEVGGAHIGNTSGYTWDVTLPNSGMELHVPLLQFRFAWDGTPGRGVQPDCFVAPELPGHEDIALAAARKLMAQPWTPATPPSCPPVDDP